VLPALAVAESLRTLGAEVTFASNSDSRLVRNAGYDPAPIVHAALARGVGFGFDVRTGELTDMRTTNIVDPLTMMSTALRVAVSCAAMALTTEALVHKPRSIRDVDVSLDP